MTGNIRISSVWGLRPSFHALFLLLLSQWHVVLQHDKVSDTACFSSRARWEAINRTGHHFCGQSSYFQHQSGNITSPPFLHCYASHKVALCRRQCVLCFPHFPSPVSWHCLHVCWAHVWMNIYTAATIFHYLRQVHPIHGSWKLRTSCKTHPRRGTSPVAGSSLIAE